jgi:hypothetical protein
MPQLGVAELSRIGRSMRAPISAFETISPSHLRPTNTINALSVGFCSCHVFPDITGIKKA